MQHIMFQTFHITNDQMDYEMVAEIYQLSLFNIKTTFITSLKMWHYNYANVNVQIK